MELSKMQIKDLKNFYETFDLTKVKQKKNVIDEVLYQLYKRPYKSKLQPRTLPAEKNNTHQMDLLFLPSDNGFKYGLTIVDVGSRLTDCEPIKDKLSDTVLAACQKIYKRKILSIPKHIQVDSGSEFKGQFKAYFDNQDIPIRTSEPDRSRQQALVESRNGSIAKPLMRRMLAQELITNKPSREWVKYLPKVLKFLNERFEIKNAPAVIKEQPLDDYNAHLIEVGTTVRYLLDKPRDMLTNKKLIGTFRHGDIRWSKPVKIEELIIQPMQIPLYLVSGRSCAYSRDQLQVITGENMPPSMTQEKFEIEKILDVKATRNSTRYLVKYKDDDKPVLIDESILKKEAPKLLKNFNR